MLINIISATDRRIPRSKIKQLLQLIDEEEEPPGSTLNVIFVRNPHIKKLNRQFRGGRGPTDVLSFNLDDAPGPGNVFGEIYISTDMAAANAVRYGGGYYREILRLCCHGFLHLLGYDHEREREKKTMEMKENYYLNKVEQ
jgi:probable rRNA maturation factor